MPFLQTANATLYFDLLTADVPHAPTVLLLHGFADTPESDFAALIPHLRARYNVLAPHLHGYGHSAHREAYPVSFYRDNVADIVTLLDMLNLSDVLVVGFSDGAIIALLLSALYPQRVRAQAVLGAQASITAQDVAAIRHWLLEQPLSPEWQKQLTELHGEPYWRSLLPLYVKGQEDLLAAGGTLISQAELAAIRCPTLIMHGSRDRVVPVAYARELQAHIPGAQLLLFEAGHAAHLRCEQEYIASVMQFFTTTLS
ncbi:alpha/beta fold hydrolase [Ktedonosporobacter rubrisoli]|uniref:Alpha/beta fold hydrolase n=1 Tax=Ktedonosporobacter rubrisoli TaxID=2509675 RepID=A0A4P6K160_KTERU|nr:alpha/beta fold hydrolase [Ktedonosporobacter rubrisoli]QBD81809.1 alpha/beta fold hydrolase [Ktedonosporobacter rubrisoli]